MSTYGHLLKDWKNHDPEMVFSDAALACLRANAQFHFENSVIFKANGKIDAISAGVVEKGSSRVDKEVDFIFDISSVDYEEIELGLDKNFDRFVKGGRLCSLAFIKNVREDNTELIFRFVFEYLRINPGDFFWFENDWIYGWEDLRKLELNPLKKNWCFINPRQ